MREALIRIINEFRTAKGEVFKKHPLGDYVRNEIPQIMYSTGIINTKKYIVTASTGKGNWNPVP